MGGDRGRIGAAARWVTLGAAVASMLACSAAHEDRPTRVALIGIDAASLEAVERLADEGFLPNLRSLMKRGTYGVLESLTPTRSPVVWTSAVTGHEPDVHGILSFRQPLAGGGESRLVNATMRRVPALWNMVSRMGRTVGFVGWWVSWPAEPVRGFIVSDHVAYSRHHIRAEQGAADAAGYGSRRGDTYPPELRDEIAPLVRRPDDLDPAEIESLVRLLPEERAQLRSGRLSRENPFRLLAFVWQQDATHRDAAIHLLRELGQPDLFGVFFRGTDVVGHLFWHTFEPEKFPGLQPSSVERLAPLLPGYYQRIDGFVGEILGALDSDTDVLVVSDHGMAASGSPDPSSTPRPGEHDLKGVFIAAGPHIEARGRTADRSLLGITPTVLRLMDLPVGEDMPVAPFDDLLGIGWSAKSIPTHGSPRPQGSVASDAVLDEQIVEELRALGYLDSP